MDGSPKRVLQTARGIQAIIDRGNPGDRLPSEVELAGQLAVSRATVRDALSRMWLKGLVTRRWGAGTFISEPQSVPDALVNAIFLDLEEVGPLRTLIRNAGHAPSMVSFSSDVVEPPRWVAEEFTLSTGARVTCLERCIAVDERPAIVLRDYLPLRIAGVELDLGPLDDFQGDFPGVFREVGLRLVKQVARMDAQSADPGVARALEIAPLAPVLHAEQRSYAETGETVICTDAYYDTTIFGTVLVRTISG